MSFIRNDEKLMSKISKESSLPSYRDWFPSSKNNVSFEIKKNYLF